MNATRRVALAAIAAAALAPALATPAHAGKASPTEVTVSYTGGTTGQYYNLKWTDPNGASYSTLFEIGPDYTGSGQTGFTAQIPGAYSVAIGAASPGGGRTFARCPVTVS
jgi:hypothetical protein